MRKLSPHPRFRLRAALCAAGRGPDLPFVRTAFIEALCSAECPRFRAAPRVCRANADRDAESWGSLLNTPLTALDRVRDTLPRCQRPFAKSRFACLRTFSDERPRFGAASFTPARRALDNPMAMACCGERAPCLPSRMWCISSRTNSPACVEGDLPSCLSRSARSRVSFSGIRPPKVELGMRSSHRRRVWSRAESGNCCNAAFLASRQED
jgi:hypothetical protein